MTIRSFIRVELGWHYFIFWFSVGVLCVAALVTAVLYWIF